MAISRLGAALRLERQIDVFEPRLAVGGENAPASSAASSLPCSRTDLRMALRRVFQLAQVAQALLQGAQLRVVERAGRFLAIAGDEGHGGAAVEQRHRRLDLLRPYPKLLRNFLVDICHARIPLYPSTRREPKSDRGTLLMDQPRLIHQGAARNRRQRIFCRTDAISPQSWGCRGFFRHPEVPERSGGLEG